jgi:hypothetical protein
MCWKVKNIMRQIADFEQFNCIRLLSKERHNDWVQLAERAQQDLDRHIIAEKILFTMHNFSHHCFNIYNAISNVLIPSNMWKTLECSHKISDEELFLLDVAVLFHDYSMQDPKIDQVHRGCHSRMSANVFRELCQKTCWDYNIFTPEQINVVCDIIQAHCDITESVPLTKQPVKIVETLAAITDPPGLNIRVKMLAGILRIADGLDVTIKRFPRENHSDLDKLSQMVNETSKKAGDDAEKEQIKDSINHWNKLKYFERAYMKDDTVKLVVTKEKYEKDSDNAAKEINDVLTRVNKTLNGVERVCNMADFSELGVCRKIEADFSEILKTEKDAIVWRTKIFYKKILPFLLEKYLPEEAPDVFNKLATDNSSSYKNHVLPFIPLVKQTNVTLVKSKKDRRVINSADEHYERLSEFINWRQKLDVKLTNGPTYILDLIENNTLHLNKSTYSDVLGTSNVNFFNLVRFFPEKYFYTYPEMVDIKQEKFPEFSNAITLWKNQLCSVVQKDSFVFDSYHAGLGVSTLTVIKKDDKSKKTDTSKKDNGYMYLITKNSEKKAAGGHDRIVIPAGTYQPCEWDDGPKGHDMDPVLQVLREFGEELLGEEELRYDKSIPNRTLYEVLAEKMTPTKLFGKILNDVLNEHQNVSLVQTGVAFDILRLRPEITYLLILNNDDSNDLFNNYKKSFESEDIEFYKLRDDNAFNTLIGNQDHPLVPPGLAALIWGRAEAIRRLNL